MGMCHMCVGVLTGQKGAQDALEPVTGGIPSLGSWSEARCLHLLLPVFFWTFLFGLVFETGTLSIANKQKVSNS